MSYSNYPKIIRENAKKAIKLNKLMGNKCATQVGKVRAQQLAKGKPLSKKTIIRMRSYLSRAKEYYNPNKPTSCGTISYNLWGGEEALRWTNKVLKKR